MSRKERDHGQEWDGLLDGLAESVLSATDEELLEDARKTGRDPKTIGDSIESLLMSSVKIHFKAERERLQIQNTVESISGRKRIPGTPQERWNLLSVLRQKLPQLAPGLATSHCRDYTQTTDADVLSDLEKFADLGILDQILGPESPEA